MKTVQLEIIRAPKLELLMAWLERIEKEMKAEALKKTA